MPRQREHDMYDEYDARSYAQFIPGSHSQQSQQYSRKHGKRKKSKHKSKRSKERGERDISRDRRESAEQNSSVEIIGRTSIVDYEDVSSDSGSLSDVSSTVAHSRTESGRSKRDQSPASAIRSYMNERSHSNSPVINEASPYRTEKSARKSKKRHRSPPVLEPVKHSDAKLKYAEPPKAYAEPPKAYAEMSAKSGYRNHSPMSPKKRRRSRTPSPYRRRSRSRYTILLLFHLIHCVLKSVSLIYLKYIYSFIANRMFNTLYEVQMKNLRISMTLFLTKNLT